MRTLSWLAVLLGIGLFTADVRAEQRQRAMLPVTVNEVSKGEVLAYVGADDVLLPTTFFDEAGIAIPKNNALHLSEGAYLSLKALSNVLRYTLDLDNLQIALTVDPQLLGHKTLSLERGSRPSDRGGDRALFFNYALNGQRSRAPDVFTEFGGSYGHQLFYSGLSRSNGTYTRGLTFYDVDRPALLQRWTAGDAVVGSDILGGVVTMGGVTIGREFTLQPYLIRSPTLDLTGTAVTPSTVEVYVNGQLVNRISVGPGVFTLRDIPVTGGLGTTKLVVRDAFGRQSVEEGSFYYSTSALKKGLSDYVFSAGAIRRDLSRSFEYGPAAALAQYRRGLTNNLTLGGRAEATKDLISGGPRITASTLLGDVDVDLAASRAAGQSGNASSLSYRFQTLRFSVGGSLVRRSDHYSTLSIEPAEDRVTREASGFFSVGLGPVSVGISAVDRRARVVEGSRQVALQVTAPLSRWGSLFASVGRLRHGNETTPSVLIGVTLSLGHYTTASTSFQHTNRENGARFEVRRPLTLENGFGYSIDEDSLLDRQFASLQYQSSFGRYEVDVDPKDTANAAYSISGGLLHIANAWLATRPLQDSFALARVGVPGVEVFSSNQPVGRTNRRGDLLIPHLLPYYDNELRISDKDVPMDYEVDATQVLAVPPARGGVVAQFPVRPLRSYTGSIRLMIIGEPYTPALGQIDVSALQPLVFSLGRNGEFYIEDLPPGSYPARLRIGHVNCDFQLVLPPTHESQTDLGVIQCIP